MENEPEESNPAELEPPAMLFKYRNARSDEQDGYDHVADLFIHHRIWFSEPHALNDPFECFPNIVPLSEEEKNEYFETRLNKYLELHPQDDYRRLEENLRANLRDPEFARESWIRERSKYGIVSLSSDPFSILQWSHYADSHRGYCVGFDTSDPNLMPIEVALPVHYNDMRPEVKHGHLLRLGGANPIDLVDKCLTTKFTHWGYEREWRLIGKPNQYQVFGSKLLTTVILGSRISDIDRERVLSAISEGPTAPAVFQATESDAAYALDLSRIG